MFLEKYSTQNKNPVKTGSSTSNREEFLTNFRGILRRTFCKISAKILELLQEEMMEEILLELFLACENFFKHRSNFQTFSIQCKTIT